MKYNALSICVLSILCFALSNCSQTIDISKTSTIKANSKLKEAKFGDFFDSTAIFDYEKFQAFRSIEDQIPEGIERRRYYDHLALLEAHLGNYYSAIDITDLKSMQPTIMFTFDSLGHKTEQLFYPSASKPQFDSTKFLLNYNSTQFDNFLSSLHDTIKLVAFNEIHSITIFRSTLFQSLTLFKQKGFKYLLIEALPAEYQEHENASKFPQIKPGPIWSEYVETVMGDIRREAKRLGFQIITYDGPASNQKIREENATQNIIKRTFEADPDAKAILFAGHGHIYENKSENFNSLGALLKQNGYDPVTIIQDTYFEKNAPDYLTKPTLFRLKNFNTIQNPKFDFTLVIPRSKKIFGRPSWLWNLNRVPVKIPYKKLVDFPCILEAFPKGEPADVVPLDRLEVKDKTNSTFLALRQGEYCIRVTSETNKIYYFNLEVNN